MIEQLLDFDPLTVPLFIAYIDPSAGHIFTSLGPAVFALLGGALSFIILYLKKIIGFFKSRFKKSDAKNKKSSSHRD